MNDVCLEKDTSTVFIQYYDKWQKAFGFKSVWSVWDKGLLEKDALVLEDRPIKISYEFVRPSATQEELSKDIEDGGKRSSALITMIAPSGTFEDVYATCEKLIELSGTHHLYIESFDKLNDGSYLLTTGS